MLKTLLGLSASLGFGSSPYAPGSSIIDSRLREIPRAQALRISVVGRDKEPASKARLCLHVLDQG